MKYLEELSAPGSFFAGLSDKHLELLAGCASEASFDVGKFVFWKGGEAQNFYLLRDGSVSLEIHAPILGTVTIQSLGKNDVLGWSWLFPPYRWEFDAQAQEPTDTLVFDAACVRSKCDEDHEFGYQILQRFSHTITERLTSARLQILDLYGKKR